MLFVFCYFSMCPINTGQPTLYVPVKAGQPSQAISVCARVLKVFRVLPHGSSYWIQGYIHNYVIEIREVMDSWLVMLSSPYCESSPHLVPVVPLRRRACRTCWSWGSK